MGPGMPPPPDVPLGPDGQPLDQGSAPQLKGPPNPKFGFVSRLMGAKHQYELEKNHEYAKFLMEQIDKSTQGVNRLPPDAMDNYIKELSRVMGSERMPSSEIKKKLESGVQMKQAAQTLQQMSAQTKAPNMGTPAMAPAAQGPAPTPAPQPPPGIPKPPPFDGGVPAGGPPPIQGEPPAMVQGASLRGTGDGIPPPAPVPAPSPVVAPVAPVRSHYLLSPAEFGQAQGEQAGSSEIAKLRALATHDQEAFDRGMTRLKSIFGEEGLKKLQPYQVVDFLTTGKITPLPMEKVSEGELSRNPNTGEVTYGLPKPINTPAGTTTTIPNLPGGAVPGQPFNPSAPGNAMQNPPAGIGNATTITSPPLREASTRDAIDAYTAQRKTEDPSYTWSDRDMNAALAAHHLATAPPDQQAQLAFNRSLEAELGRKLTDKELATANVKYQGMLAEGKETSDTKAMRAVAAQLAQLRADQLREENSPESLKASADAWSRFGIVPRNGKEADKTVRYAIANNIELPVPLSGAAQTQMQQTQPILDMIGRIKKELEPIKNSPTPAAELLPRIAYALGFGNDTSKLLSQLELGRITQGANVIKGVSRSEGVLNKAMIHMPNTWKDSGKLMYDKIENVEQALGDRVHAIKMYGLKSGVVVQPGMPEPPPGGLTAPPIDLSKFDKK